MTRRLPQPDTAYLCWSAGAALDPVNLGLNRADAARIFNGSRDPQARRQALAELWQCAVSSS